MNQDNVINNDPELNGKFLGKITQDFIKISDHIKEASYHIRKNGFSDFPIFPVSKDLIMSKWSKTIPAIFSAEKGE